MSGQLTAVPVAPERFPLIGHAIPLWRHSLQFLLSLHSIGDIVRVDVGNRPIYFLTTPQLVRDLLRTQQDSFDKGFVFDRIRPLLGNGLVTSNGDFHHRQRRLIQPAFHHKQIAHYAEIMQRNAVELISSWYPHQTVPIAEIMYKLTLTTIAQTMFSTELGEKAVLEVQRSLPILMKDVIKRAVIPKPFSWLTFAINHRFDAAALRLRHIIDAVIQQYRTDNVNQGDLLSMLLAVRDEVGQGLTDEQIRDELVTIMVAGTETSATTLSWAIHELANNPISEQMLLQEINTVVGNRECTFADISNLGFTSRLLNETLRLHSPPLLMRRAIKPTTIGGFTIPIGTELAYSPYALHRNPELFPQPAQFDPNRWLPEHASQLPRGAFIPFGAGNRKCIGDGFAWAQMVITLITIINHWKLQHATGHTVREIPAGIVRPDALPMVVSRRVAVKSTVDTR
jgi:cytochrome P450